MQDTGSSIVQSSADDLSAWLPAREWVEANGGRIFKTFASFEWFLRGHRDELTRAGVFLRLTGQRGSLCGPGLSAKILEILRREALETIDASKAAQR